MALSHACLKYLALLEPQLVVQSVLDRAYPSLTGLEEVGPGSSPHHLATDWRR